MLQKHFGDSILIPEINGTENVVTFRRGAPSILHNFYQQSRQLDCELEKLRMVEAALIKTDIKSIIQSKELYPTTLEMASAKETLSYLPNSLRRFLDVLFVGKKKNLKISPVGQAMMQAT